MDLFNRTAWSRLADVDSFPCVSIFMPTHRSGPEIRQNSIRCRNLLDDAAEQLHDHDVRTPVVETLLSPARQLLRNDDFWQHQSEGLALFLATGIFEQYRVPLHFEELVVVDHRFHLKPLLSMLQGDGQFYVLAVSAKEVRLFQGSRYTMRQIETDALPPDLVFAPNITPVFEDLDGRTRTDPTTLSTAGEATFYGQGAMADSQRMNGELRNFFQRIDRGLKQFFTIERAPLVFAGTENLFPIFRSTCHLANIVETPITAGAKSLSPQQLHDQAWPLVAPLFEKERHARLARFGAQLGTGMASQLIEMIIMAARQGAVDALFAPRGAQCWGTIDEQQGEVRVHANRQPGDEDLLDRAATQTLLNSGLVYMLEPQEMPQGTTVAALFRYPVTPTLQTNRSR